MDAPEAVEGGRWLVAGGDRGGAQAGLGRGSPAAQAIRAFNDGTGAYRGYLVGRFQAIDSGQVVVEFRCARRTASSHDRSLGTVVANADNNNLLTAGEDDDGYFAISGQRPQKCNTVRHVICDASI